MKQALSTKFGRLAQGNKYGVKSTNTIDFIQKSEVLLNRKVTYTYFVCNHKPLKQQQCQVRCVAGGDKIPYPGDSSSPAASLLNTKLMFNSTISDAAAGAPFPSADLGDFFLGSIMAWPEFMCIPFSIFPDKIIEQYNLRNFFCRKGYIYIRIKKGIYDLKQAAVLTHHQLIAHLKPFGYSPMLFSLSL